MHGTGIEASFSLANVARHAGYICIMILVWAGAPLRAEEPRKVADRVIVAINNLPFTQLQLERYLATKESLRDNPQESQLVGSANWTLALDAFVTDMTIYHDATKSSGFRPSREAIQKLRARAEGNVKLLPQFSGAFTRLGLTRPNLEAEILKVATVENYRRGKQSFREEPGNISPSWEKDLRQRTIVRLFDKAEDWLELSPLP